MKIAITFTEQEMKLLIKVLDFSAKNSEPDSFKQKQEETLLHKLNRINHITDYDN